MKVTINEEPARLVSQQYPVLKISKSKKVGRIALFINNKSEDNAIHIVRTPSSDFKEYLYELGQVICLNEDGYEIYNGSITLSNQ